MPFHGGNRGSNPRGDASKTPIETVSNLACTGLQVQNDGRHHPMDEVLNPALI